MGTDICIAIHCMDGNGAWAFLPWSYQDAPEVFLDRNYDLFYFLAGVRNGVVKPFMEQRGLPTDLCEDDVIPYSNGENSLGTDDDGEQVLGTFRGFAHTWFLLDELKAAPWPDERNWEHCRIRRWADESLPWLEEVAAGRPLRLTIWFSD